MNSEGKNENGEVHNILYINEKSFKNFFNREYGFAYCDTLQVINLSIFKTEKVSNMKLVFGSLVNVKIIDISLLI